MRMRIASPASGTERGIASGMVVAGGIEGDEDADKAVAEGTGVITGAGVAVVVTAVVSGCVNCDREKPYTVAASTAAINEPSPLTATERALIGFFAVKDPSFVPARSKTERFLSMLPAAIVFPSSETATLVIQCVARAVQSRVPLRSSACTVLSSLPTTIVEPSRE
jgi:hypothetical protein